jgi:ribosomal protein S17
VETQRHHPLYKKIIKRTVRFKVHDEKKECGPGDRVRIIETRPLSKEKRWRVAEVVTKGVVVEVPAAIVPAEVPPQPEAPTPPASPG